MIDINLKFTEEPLEDGSSNIAIAIDNNDTDCTELENVFGYLITRKAVEETYRLKNLLKESKCKEIFEEAETFYKQDLKKGELKK